jgi:translation initiation factor 1A
MSSKNTSSSSKKGKTVANKNKNKINVKRDLFLKSSIPNSDGMTVYGQIEEALGDYNYRVLCYDGKLRLCHVRGSIKQKHERAEKECIVIVGLRDFNDSKGDIIYVYKKEESAELLRLKEIPNFSSSEDDLYATEDCEDTFDFTSL